MGGPGGQAQVAAARRERWGAPGPLGALARRALAGAGQWPPAKPDPHPAGCSFGGKVYAVDETWHPDLGEPFGVMHCVLCACEAVSGARDERGAHECGRGGLSGGVSLTHSELLGRKGAILRMFGAFFTLPLKFSFLEGEKRTLFSSFDEAHSGVD